MRRGRTWFALGAVLLAAQVKQASAAPLGTAFTYQGRLKNGGGGANGVYDVQFSLWDAVSGGTQVGGTVCSDNVSIADGLFTVTLNAGGEFGPAAFKGQARWLQTGVRPGGAAGNCASGAYTLLSPRQPLVAAPYSLYALNMFWAASGNNIANINSGNVGIGTGTASPMEKLHVAGNVVAGGDLRSSNPNEPASVVFLGWGVDGAGTPMARIRIGGDGPGATNGIEIQRTGDRHLMRVLNNGNVTTDDRGYATVELPEWFEALNREFRYQLTVIDDQDSDDWVFAKVVREIQTNRFTLRTSRPKTRVSWQVTGIRHDKHAEAHRIPVEEDKSPAERGRYLHPDLYGKSEEFAVYAEKLRAREDKPPARPAQPDFGPDSSKK